jgi:protein FrlC
MADQRIGKVLWDRGYKIALSNFSWFNHFMEYGIKKTAELGYMGIDLNGNRPLCDPRDLTAEDRKNVKKMLEENELQLAAITPFCGNYHWCLSTLIKPVREDSVKHVKECIDLAHEWGAKIVESVTGPPMFVEDDMRQAWNRTKESLKQITDHAAKKGITIALEFRISVADRTTYIVHKLDDALLMIEDVGAENLGVLIDVNHAALDLYMNIGEQIEKAGDKLVHMHISDSPLGVHRHLPIGEGKVQWPLVFKILKKIGYQGWITLEMEEVQDAYSASYDALYKLEEFTRDL